MFRASAIEIELAEVDHQVVPIAARTPVGIIEILGRVETEGTSPARGQRALGGLAANAIGVAGLNAIAQRVLEEADVDEIVVHGATRTTGRGVGRRPRVFRYRRRHSD